MGTGEQLVTIAAVLLGALSTHVANYAMERVRMRQERLTRWDSSKLAAYETFVDEVRASIFLSVDLYESVEGIRANIKPESELRQDLADSIRRRGRSFERVMLLGGDDVVEAAHQLQTATRKIDWQADGRTEGSLEDWRALHRDAFREINEFHETARIDLGVQGSVKGEKHPQRDLLLPSARDERQSNENR